jgi:hypothetical protein
MEEQERTYTKKSFSPAKKLTKKTAEKVKLPPQNGPRDTTNWDNKVYKAPDGRLIIETDQTKKGINVSD